MRDRIREFPFFFCLKEIRLDGDVCIQHGGTEIRVFLYQFGRSVGTLQGGGERQVSS